MHFNDLVSLILESNKQLKTGMFKDRDGTKLWYVNNKEHRLDGPAVEYANGDKEWFVNGKRHRLDGPAIEWADGTKAWYVNGKRHRLDGPAVEWADGSKFWFINGEELPETEFNAYKKQQDVKDIISKKDKSGWDL